MRQKMEHDQQTIVVMGASGAVGKQLVALLAAKGRYKLVIAGRRRVPLEELSKSLNGVASVLQTDLRQVKDLGFLQSACLLIMCVDIENDLVPKACIEHGVHYMDISASAGVYNILKTLDTRARQQGVALLFSVGLAPGLTNILSKHVLSAMPSASKLELYVLLGLGEAHGDRAYQWTFDNLHKKYRIKTKGKHEVVKSFSSGKTTWLAGKRRQFYLFDFVDQHIIGGAVPVSSVSTRMAFDNSFFTVLVAFMRKVGLTRIYRNAFIQKLMMKLMGKLRSGSDLYGVKALAKNEHGEEVAASLTGRSQGQVTALVTAELVDRLWDSNASGLLQADDLVPDVPLFLEHLRSLSVGMTIEIGHVTQTS